VPAGFVFPGKRPLARAAAFAGIAVALFAPPTHADAEALPPSPSHTRAYVALGAGGALTLLSFVFADQADADYARYLAETDPSRLEDAYQEARRMDRLSAATLIAGQAGLALGVYWRFLRTPRASADARAPRPAWSVGPRLGPRGAGLALDVRF
jgi:hypothetical protein